jgi:hypothetical protein
VRTGPLRARRRRRYCAVGFGARRGARTIRSGLRVAITSSAPARLRLPRRRRAARCGPRPRRSVAPRARRGGRAAATSPRSRVAVARGPAHLRQRAPTRRATGRGRGARQRRGRRRRRGAALVARGARTARWPLQLHPGGRRARRRPTSFRPAADRSRRYERGRRARPARHGGPRLDRRRGAGGRLVRWRERPRDSDVRRRHHGWVRRSHRRGGQRERGRRVDHRLRLDDGASSPAVASSALTPPVRRGRGRARRAGGPRAPRRRPRSGRPRRT